MARILDRLAVAMAVLGGAVLMGLVALICVSVTGRALGTAAAPGAEWLDWAGAIKGDFEIIEACMGFAIFAFLPLCQLRGGHAHVDLVTSQFPPALTRWLATFWEAVFSAVLALITWRLAVATLDKMCIPARFTGAWCSVETSFLIGFPIWWSYAACLIAAVLATITALWCTGRRITHGDLPERPRYEEPL